MSVKYNPDDYHEHSLFPIKFIEKLRVKKTMRLLNIQKDDIVLEIGCGAGNLMQVINSGWVVGLDLSSHLLELAKSKSYAIRCDLIQSYGETMPFKDATFDKIYCSEVLEHVKEPIDICREASRALKKEGIFVISVPNESFINIIKMVIYKLRIDKILNSVTKYKFPTDMMEEWHLHSLPLNYFKANITDMFIVDRVRYVPCALFPIRMIISCSKKA